MLIDNSSKIVEGISLSTKEGWEAYIQHELEWAIGWAREQELKHQVVLFCERDPQTLEPYDEPRPHLLIPMHKDGASDDEVNETKNIFVYACRAMALCGKAIACITHSEAWLSTCVTKEEVQNPDRPQPKDDPARLEALIALVEHRDFGSTMHTAFIRNDQGHRVVADWEDAPKDVSLQGRMTGLVPPLEIFDDPAAQVAIKLAQELLGCEEVRWTQ